MEKVSECQVGSFDRKLERRRGKKEERKRARELEKIMRVWVDGGMVVVVVDREKA